MNIWLDITTTLGWGRPALGIVRVEAETLRHFLSIGEDRVRLCSFEMGSRSYREVSREEALEALARLDAGGHNQSAHRAPPTARPEIKAAAPRPVTPALSTRLEQWGREAITRLPGRYQLHARHWALRCRALLRKLSETQPAPNGSTPSAIMTATPQHDPVSPFSAGDTYISLGLDWDQKDLSILYALKQRLDLRIILFCYDIIPILMPEHCAPGVPEKFPGYFADAAWCADLILCISECSRKDLGNYLHSVGAPVPKLGIARLGADIPASATQPPSAEIAELLKERYILFVSTMEARKNHRILYQAYKKLMADGHHDLPKLIFVGMQGWGVEQLIRDLSEPQIQSRILRLQNVSDSDLAHLYRHCLFTAYPSLYEGWGIPVAESLAYGRFCLASDAASIPEVGGSLIEYISPQDESAWAERLAWYFKNPQAVESRQQIIKSDYRPVLWSDTGAAIFQTAIAMQDSAPQLTAFSD